MQILVTGAGGLIGTHLVPLLEAEHELFTLSGIKGRKNNTYIDFSKEWSTEALPTGLDVIIHLAQSEDFRDFPAKAIEVFNINTESTLKLAAFANNTGVKKIIYASSGGIYGSSDDPFTEVQGKGYEPGMGFYIATKHCSEVILDNFTSLLDVIQLRFFFVYGKGQRKEMLMPRILNNVLEEKPINLNGDDGIKINPIHVTDAALAIKAALHLQGSHKINIGGTEVLSLKEIAEIIGRRTGKDPQFNIDKEIKPKHLIGDISKMKKLLVSPAMKFQEGIESLL